MEESDTVASETITERETDSDSPEQPDDSHDGAGQSTPAGSRRRRLPGWMMLTRVLARPLLAAVVAALVGLAAAGGALWMHLEASALRKPTENVALLDAEATKQVSSAISEAVERVYGYSYRSLDKDEAAQEVVTGAFAKKFRNQFATVRKLAPQQKAVVNASVAAAAVRSLTRDHAEVLVFLNQTLRNKELSKPASTGSRLMVTAERVDGRWKISKVVSQ